MSKRSRRLKKRRKADRKATKERVAIESAFKTYRCFSIPVSDRDINYLYCDEPTPYEASINALNPSSASWFRKEFEVIGSKETKKGLFIQQCGRAHRSGKTLEANKKILERISANTDELLNVFFGVKKATMFSPKIDFSGGRHATRSYHDASYGNAVPPTSQGKSALFSQMFKKDSSVKKEDPISDLKIFVEQGMIVPIKPLSFFSTINEILNSIDKKEKELKMKKNNNEELSKKSKKDFKLVPSNALTQTGRCEECAFTEQGCFDIRGCGSIKNEIGIEKLRDSHECKERKEVYKLIDDSQKLSINDLELGMVVLYIGESSQNLVNGETYTIIGIRHRYTFQVRLRQDSTLFSCMLNSLENIVPIGGVLKTPCVNTPTIKVQRNIKGNSVAEVRKAEPMFDESKIERLDIRDLCMEKNIDLGLYFNFGQWVERIRISDLQYVCDVSSMDFIKGRGYRVLTGSCSTRWSDKPKDRDMTLDEAMDYCYINRLIPCKVIRGRQFLNSSFTSDDKIENLRYKEVGDPELHEFPKEKTKNV